MKRLVFSILLFLATSVTPVFAQDMPIDSPMPTDTPTPIVTPTVSYDLPYPGLLPNSPLYIFRMIRDNVIRLFISDPLKKAQFDLLQADKRLNAAEYLLMQSNVDQEQVATTIDKAENYFALSLSDLLTAKQQGKEVKDFARQLSVASRKHEELLQKIAQTNKKTIKDAAIRNEKRVRDFKKQADNYSNYHEPQPK